VSSPPIEGPLTHCKNTAAKVDYWPRNTSTKLLKICYMLKALPFRGSFLANWVIVMRAVISALVGLALLVPVAAAAADTAYCVSCDGPAAHYACTFDGTGADPNDASLKLLCITELAKSGKHASCSVDRKQPSPCPGDTKVMALPEGHPSAAQPTMAAPANTAKPAAEPAQAVPQPKPANETAVEKTEAPPKTVQEMVEKGTSNTGKVLEKTGETAADAAKSTGSAVEKAGKAVGDAAKKTWTCITSLFGNC
jgi:hypothetical protein